MEYVKITFFIHFHQICTCLLLQPWLMKRKSTSATSIGGGTSAIIRKNKKFESYSKEKEVQVFYYIDMKRKISYFEDVIELRNCFIKYSIDIILIL